jgi:hypothetical protein
VTEWNRDVVGEDLAVRVEAAGRAEAIAWALCAGDCRPVEPLFAPRQQGEPRAWHISG